MLICMNLRQTGCKRAADFVHVVHFECQCGRNREGWCKQTRKNVPQLARFQAPCTSMQGRETRVCRLEHEFLASVRYRALASLR